MDFVFYYCCYDFDFCSNNPDFFVLFMMIAGRSIMSGVFIFCFQTLILTLFVCGRIVKFHFFIKIK